VGGDEVWIGAVDEVSKKKKKETGVQMAGCAGNPVLSVGSQMVRHWMVKLCRVQ